MAMCSDVGTLPLLIRFAVRNPTLKPFNLLVDFVVCHPVLRAQHFRPGSGLPYVTLCLNLAQVRTRVRGGLFYFVPRYLDNQVLDRPQPLSCEHVAQFVANRCHTPLTP